MELQINGQVLQADAEPEMPLLWVLRELLDLTGTKHGCGVGACGACTVRLAGKPVRSCVLPVSEAVGQQVQTIEGLSASRRLHPLQQAWIDEQVPQCGFCQSGMLMAAAALLERSPRPTDAEIDQALAHNVCACATYVRVRKAIHRAAGLSP